MKPELHLLSGTWPEEPGLDTALSKLVLDRVSAGEMPATIRLYVPGREVAFGKRDAVTPQYAAAVTAASGVGFTSVERLAGGRAAVFTEHTIAYALAIPDDDPRITIHRRFSEMSELVVAAFGRVGVPAEIGEVPGEYCPGDFSVHHDHRLKLMGVGQRLAKHAAHVGGVIAVDRTDLLLRALIPVYRALNLEWRPTTTGTLADVNSSVTTDSVFDALKVELDSRYTVTKGRFDNALVKQARSLAHRHLPVEVG